MYLSYLQLPEAAVTVHFMSRMCHIGNAVISTALSLLEGLQVIRCFSGSDIFAV